MKQNDLFDLINSLEKNEQIYFKKYISEGISEKSDKQYLILYNAISNQKEYDEEQLKLNLPKSISKNLSRYKNYLYNILLKSTKSFHSENIDQLKVFNLINDYNLLLAKGLENQAHERLMMARNLVKGSCSYELEILINSMEESIKGNHYSIDQMKKSVENTEALISNFTKSLEIVKIHFELKELTEAGHEVEDYELKLKKIEQMNSFNLSSENLDTKLSLKYYSMLSSYYRSKNDWEEAFIHMQNAQIFVKNNLTYVQFNKKAYFALLSNCLLFASHLDKKEECALYLEEYESMLSQETRFGKSISTLYKQLLFYVNKLDYTLKWEDISNNEKLCEEKIEPWYLKNESRVKFAAMGSLNFLLIITFWFSHNSKKAKKWIIKYEQFALDKKEYQYLLLTKLLLCGIYMETKEEKWLKIELGNIGKLIQSKNFKIQEIDKIMHSFFKRKLRVKKFDGQSEYQELLNKLNLAIESNQESKDHNSLYRYKEWAQFMLQKEVLS